MKRMRGFAKAKKKKKRKEKKEWQVKIANVPSHQKGKTEWIDKNSRKDENITRNIREEKTRARDLVSFTCYTPAPVLSTTRP